MRQVTEADFRAPEFRDAKTEDYEFREDGKIVRKDRWERGLMSIRHMVILGRREFEIPEVVEAVRKLAADNEWYHDFKEMEPGTYDLLLDDKSVLRNVKFAKGVFTWRGAVWDRGIDGFREVNEVTEEKVS